jgi:hypothetical protein
MSSAGKSWVVAAGPNVSLIFQSNTLHMSMCTWHWSSLLVRCRRVDLQTNWPLDVRNLAVHITHDAADVSRTTNHDVSGTLPLVMSMSELVKERTSASNSRQWSKRVVGDLVLIIFRYVHPLAACCHGE